MKKYQTTTIGEFHTNHNEDFLIINEIGEHQLLIAVMDGCSMGKESHFASTLIGKILRKISKEIYFRSFVEKTKMTLIELLKQVIEKLFNDLKDIKHRLMLEREELLSTLILGILNQENKTIELLTIGDGLICCNGVYYEYEQDDKPDYLGYHLTEEFDDWYDQQKQRLSFENVKDLSISTDGIFTFRKFDNKNYQPIKATALIDFLLIDKKGLGQENMLTRKLFEIEKIYGLKPTDDLTIVRVLEEANF